MTTYTVQLEVEINAASPRQAATIARDMMLNPDVYLHFDVLPMVWIEGAEEYHPTDRRGWYASFEGSVHPKDFFAWSTME